MSDPTPDSSPAGRESANGATGDDRAVMQQIDRLLSHVWMVRTFLKHSEESQEDEELQSIHRTLYDFMLALGPSLAADDAQAYLRQAGKKLGKLRRATQLLEEIQPEVSQHTNFQMATLSLRVAVDEVSRLLDERRR